MTFKPASVATLWTALSVMVLAQSAQGPATAPVERPTQRVVVRPVTADDLSRPAAADWLTYHGSYTGNHFSTLTQVDMQTVARLQRAWVSDTDAPAAPAGRGAGRVGGAGAGAAAGAGRGGRAAGTPPAPVPPGRTGVGRAGGFGGNIASAPIVRDGVVFYTLGVNAYAIDGRTGRQLWHYIARSSGGLSNRGLAIAGDTLFMMANGGLTALDVTTGTERWV